MALTLAWNKIEAAVEETLDAWLGEKVVLYALRYFLVLWTCFVIGAFLLRVIGIVKSGRRHSPDERRGWECWRERRVGSKTCTVTVALSPAGAVPKIGTRTREVVTLNSDSVPDVVDTCILM
jgi:hypothetical protein